MTTTQTNTPGLPTVQDGLLVSTNPATGKEVARVPIAGSDDVAGRTVAPLTMRRLP